MSAEAAAPAAVHPGFIFATLLLAPPQLATGHRVTIELDSSLRPLARAGARAAVLPALPDEVDPEALSSLVGAIYDTTLAPQQWRAVLGACRDFAGGAAAAIIRKDINGIAGGIFHDDGTIGPAEGQLYFEKYCRLDPTAAGHLFAEIGEPLGTADLVDYDEFRQSRFYREWAEPQGMVDFASATIEKASGWAALFGVFRHTSQGVVDEPMKHRMRLIIPHIQRAVLIGKVIERANVEAASFGDSLDGLAAGMFLVDATGRVVHANAAGLAMLDAGDPLAARNGRIVSVDREAFAALGEVFAAASAGDAAVGVRGISVAITGREGDNYVAHVLPLTSGARRRAGASYAAVAALFVQRATLDTPVAPEIIARTFGLTLSELRVLLAIVQVGGVPETANALGVAESTVKTHLQHVFGKTGVARQADLVKLVAGYASPLSS